MQHAAPVMFGQEDFGANMGGLSGTLHLNITGKPIRTRKKKKSHPSARPPPSRRTEDLAPRLLWEEGDDLPAARASWSHASRADNACRSPAGPACLPTMQPVCRLPITSNYPCIL